MTDLQKIRILIADDHGCFRDGLKVWLHKAKANYEVVGEAENGEQAISLTASLLPDIIFMDIRMPGLDGIAATKIIIDQNPDARIIALSQFDDDLCVLDMIEAGAKGYLLKNVGKEELRMAIQTIHSGNVYFTQEVMQHLIKDPGIKSSHRNPIKFTTRELEVFQLICLGKRSKEIAQILGISKRTVDCHRDNLLNKAGVNSTLELFKFAIHHGIHKE